ncbi:MAG: glycosyltransferase [Acidimicrobiales bacterium]|nr:glycosyltransferase [Acidimicrobiales bacterium]
MTEEIRLSVVIPAFGEEGTIGPTLERIRAELSEHLEPNDLEIVVVDDGSSDATAQQAKLAGADVVIEFSKNRGKGAAVRAGMLGASGRVRAFTDADLSYAPRQIMSLLEGIEAGADAVTGNRYHPDSQTITETTGLRRIGSKAINQTTRLVLQKPYADTQSGLKAFRAAVAEVVFKRCQIDGFAFDVEVLHLLERYNLKVVDVPVEVANSASSTVHLLADGMLFIKDLSRINRLAKSGAYDLTSQERDLLLLGTTAAEG